MYPTPFTWFLQIVHQQITGFHCFFTFPLVKRVRSAFLCLSETRNALPMAATSVRIVTYLEQLLTIKPHDYVITWSFARSRDKLKTLYIQYHNAYGHQAWQGGYIQWGASFHKVKRPFDHVALQGLMTDKIRYISTTKMTVAMKLGRVVTYKGELPPIKSQDPLILRSYKVTWQIKYLISLLLQGLRLLNLAMWWVIIRGFHA